MAGAGLLLAWAIPAFADPCTAIPDRGPMPADLRPGNMFEGRVSYVGDGDSLCVALGPQPTEWVEVRLADFYAPELATDEGKRAKAALNKLALGRIARCEAGRRSYDRVVATCRIGGVAIGQSLRSAGVAEGGRGANYRPPNRRAPGGRQQAVE